MKKAGISQFCLPSSKTVISVQAGSNQRLVSISSMEKRTAHSVLMQSPRNRGAMASPFHRFCLLILKMTRCYCKSQRCFWLCMNAIFIYLQLVLFRNNNMLENIIYIAPSLLSISSFCLFSFFLETFFLAGSASSETLEKACSFSTKTISM